MGNPLALQLYTVRDQLAADRPEYCRASPPSATARSSRSASSPTRRGCGPTWMRPAWPCAACTRRPRRARRRRLPRRPHPRRGHRHRPLPAAARFADADSVRGAGGGAERNGRPAGRPGPAPGLPQPRFRARPRCVGGTPGRWRCWPTSSTRRCCSRSTPTGRRWAGRMWPRCCGRLGDRVRYLHVKDGPVTRDDFMTAVGSRADAGGRDPGRRPAGRVARGRARPLRDRHDDRGRGQPGLADRPGPGPAGRRGAVA